jgi:hypothetical protein
LFKTNIKEMYSESDKGLQQLQKKD